MHSFRLNNKSEGFTLIEILISIILILVVMVLLFDAFSGILNSDAKIEQYSVEERKIFLFFNYMSQLIKNMSAIQVTYNLKKTYFFYGERNNMVFLSKQPIIYPLHVLHFVGVEWRNDRLNYKERIFNNGDNVRSFDVFDQSNFVLLKDIKNLKINYYVWNSLVNHSEWKNVVNTYNGDELPSKVMIEFTLNKKKHQFIFNRFLNEYQHYIPKI